MPTRSEPDDGRASRTLARHRGPRGEVVLRRRSGRPPVEELIVNGVFAMDSGDTSTERTLARFAVGADRVLVGGLGLGYTAAELLGGGVGSLDVVEIEACLIDWARTGLSPVLAAVAADPRTRLWVEDVAAVLTGTADAPRGRWDAILLDVDNGPEFLIHDHNRELYAEPGLRTAFGRLTPGGTLALWSQAPSPTLLAGLNVLDPSAAEHVLDTERDGRRWRYAVYTVRRRVF